MPEYVSDEVAAALRQLDLQAKANNDQHVQECQAISKSGSEQFGNDVYEPCERAVVSKLGPKQRQFEEVLRQTNNPAQLLMTLAEDPDALDRVLNLPPARQLMELARIENKGTTGNVSIAPTPTYQQRAGRTYLSEKEFNSPLQDQLSDSQYDRHFERFQQKRHERFKARGY